MANEVTLSGALEYDDGKVTKSVSIADVVKSISGGTKRVTETVQSVGTSEEAVDLGEVSAPGYAIFQNLDDTNSIDLKVATAGAIFARLDADLNDDGKGGFALLKLGSGAQAPYAIANTAACRMRVIVIEA
jgi:hypothetical protein